MKVLHILNSTTYSGAENVACQIITMSHGEGVDAAYCSPDGPIKEFLSKKGIPYYPVNRLSVGEIRRVVNNYQPDIVHAHDLRASFIASLVVGKTIKLISHIHGNNEELKKLSLRTILYRYASRRADRIIWLSESARDNYRYHSEVSGKSVILPNIVDEKILKALADDGDARQYDIVYLGRITSIKNPIRMIRLLDGVKKICPDLSAAVIGDGDLREDIKSLASTLGLDDTVDFFGYIENPHPILSRAKCLIITSNSEGMPMCALEALSLGVPVFGVPAGGLVSLVKNDVNGYLSEDDELLIKLIAEYLTDKNKQDNYRDGAITQSLSHNDKKRYISTLLSIYG